MIPIAVHTSPSTNHHYFFISAATAAPQNHTATAIMSDDESSVLSDRGTTSPQPLSMASAAVPVQEEAPAQQETPAQDEEPSNDYSEESQFEQFKHELPRAYLAAAKTAYPHIPRDGVKPIEYPTLVSAKAVGKSLLSNIEVSASIPLSLQ